MVCTLLLAGCAEEEPTVIEFDHQFANLVLGGHVAEVEIVRGDEGALVITGKTVQSEREEDPSLFFTLQVPKRRAAALRRFLAESGVTYTTPLGPTNMKAFVTGFAIIATLLVALMVLSLWRGRQAWQHAKKLWTKRDLIRQAAKDLLKGIREVLRLPPFSDDDAYDIRLILAETLERFAVATIVTMLLLFMGQRFSSIFGPAITVLVPGPINKAVDILPRLLLLSLRLSLISLAGGMMIGAISRFLFLTRWLFKPLGTVGRFVFFGIPVLVLNTVLAHHFLPQTPLGFLGMFVLIPTTSLFPGCFELTDIVVPEVTQVRKHIRECWSRIRPRHSSQAEPESENGRHSESQDSRDVPPKKSASGKAAQYAEVLGVSSDAEFSEIRKKYLEMAKQYHPDHVQHLGPKLRATADREMKAVNEAYAYFDKRHNG